VLLTFVFQDSKRSFLHSLVHHEGGSKLDAFINFSEDTIFEVFDENPLLGVVSKAHRNTSHIMSTAHCRDCHRSLL